MPTRRTSNDGPSGRPAKRHQKLKAEPEDDDEESNQQLKTPDNSGLFMTPPPGNEFRLCDEQVDAVGAILSGANIFLTGCAGSGKTAVLKAAIDMLRAKERRVRIAAPTGKAACNINGTTLHCLFGLGKTPKGILDLEDMASSRKEICQRLEDMDVLVIDEISMVENIFFERLNRMAKAARADDEKAFGGVQIIVCGDFRQLPPVLPFASCFGCGQATEKKWDRRLRVNTMYCSTCHGAEDIDDQWAFCSQAWDHANFLNINLTQNHRQDEREFINVLSKLSVGSTLSTDDRNLVLNHPCNVEGAVHIYPRTVDVDAMNQREYRALQGQPVEYKCLDHFRWNRMNRQLGCFGAWSKDGYTLEALWQHQYRPTLSFKEAMPVVLLVNIDVEKGLVNGSQGTICRFKHYPSSALPRPGSGVDHIQLKAGEMPDEDDTGRRVVRGSEYAAYRHGQETDFLITGNPGVPLPVVRFHNGLVRTIWPECSYAQVGDDKPVSLLSRTQIPLAAGWAMTIHKAQGMTMDKVIVSTTGMFCPSHAYVALSRARTLHGLKVEGNGQGLDVVGADEKVEDFMKSREWFVG